MHVSLCVHVYVYSQLGRNLHLCIMQINEILVISLFVKCITNNTRKEIIEKRCSPWLFSWHDHGWMSASVRRGLENIKDRENQHKLKAIQVYKEKALTAKLLHSQIMMRPTWCGCSPVL